jgi:hemerythrin-like domain-containing protein
MHNFSLCIFANSNNAQEKAMISFSALEAAASYDNPLALLHACHGKILAQCVTLQKLAGHLDSNGCDLQAQQAAQKILHYFDTSGQFHHQDEEENLFPTLRLCAGADKPAVDALLDRLLSDHAVMAAAWSELRGVLLLLAKGENEPLDDALLQKFIKSYTDHIAVEERDLLPLAARLLSPQQVAQIGRQMAERRGVRLAHLNDK